MMMSALQKLPFPGLLLLAVPGYSFPAAAKPAAGIGVPRNSMATQPPPGRFFFFLAQAHPFFRLLFFFPPPFFFL
ncbi:Ash-like/host cell division inhibitor Icd-like protein, partial [Kosakonia sacchari]